MSEPRCKCGHTYLTHDWRGCMRWVCRCKRTYVELALDRATKENDRE